MSRNNSGCAYTWGGRGEGARKLSHFVFCVCRDSPSRLPVSPPVGSWGRHHFPFLPSRSLSFPSSLSLLRVMHMAPTIGGGSGGKETGRGFQFNYCTKRRLPWSHMLSHLRLTNFAPPALLHEIRFRSLLFLSPVHSLAHISDRVRNKTTCSISSLPLSSSLLLPPILSTIPQSAFLSRPQLQGTTYTRVGRCTHSLSSRLWRRGRGIRDDAATYVLSPLEQSRCFSSPPDPSLSVAMHTNTVADLRRHLPLPLPPTLARQRKQMPQEEKKRRRERESKGKWRGRSLSRTTTPFSSSSS